MQKSSPKICDLASANGNNNCKLNKLDNKQTPSMWIEDGVVCQGYSRFDDKPASDSKYLQRNKTDDDENSTDTKTGRTVEEGEIVEAAEGTAVEVEEGEIIEDERRG